jgi:hypothetical protein
VPGMWGLPRVDLNLRSRANSVADGSSAAAMPSMSCQTRYRLCDSATLLTHQKVAKVVPFGDLFATDSRVAEGSSNDDESVYALHAVPKNVVKECDIAGDPVEWHISGAGLWAEAIRERKALFNSDCDLPHPTKKAN